MALPRSLRFDLKHYHWVFFSVVATVACSELVLWVRSRRLARLAAQGGEEHKNEVVLSVTTNETMSWMEEAIRNVLEDSVPNAQLSFNEDDTVDELVDLSALDIARNRAMTSVNNLKKESASWSIMYGVGMHVTTMSGLKQIWIVVYEVEKDIESIAREGYTCSIGVPPMIFEAKDFEAAFSKAWQQMLLN